MKKKSVFENIDHRRAQNKSDLFIYRSVESAMRGEEKKDYTFIDFEFTVISLDRKGQSPRN